MDQKKSSSEHQRMLGIADIKPVAITGELGNDTTAMKKSCKEVPQKYRKDIDHVQSQTTRVEETTMRLGVPQFEDTSHQNPVAQKTLIVRRL